MVANKHMNKYYRCVGDEESRPFGLMFDPRAATLFAPIFRVSLA